MEAHFRDQIGAGPAAESILAQARREAGSPFAFFDAVICFHDDLSRDRWERVRQGFAALDIDWLVEPMLARLDVGAAQPGVPASAIRVILAGIKQRGLANVLIVRDEAVLSLAGLEELRRAVAELPEPGWRIWHLTDHAFAVSRDGYDDASCRYWGQVSEKPMANEHRRLGGTAVAVCGPS
jgi:hypothetical protein